MNLEGLRRTFTLRSRFNREVLWSIGSLGVMGASGILLNIFIGTFREEDALGVFNQVYAVYIFLSQIAVGGVHSSVLMQVSHRQDDKAECARLTVSALILAAGLSLCVCAAAYWSRESIGRLFGSPAVGQGLGYAIPGLFFFSLNKILLSVLNGMRSMRSLSIFNSLRFVILFLAVAGMVALDYDDVWLPGAFAIAEGALFIGLVFDVNIRLFPLWKFRGLGDWHRSHLSYGARGILSGILADLNTRVDVLMLGFFLSDSAVGIYTMASSISEGLLQFPALLQRNVNPIIGKAFAEGRLQKIEEAARKVRRVVYGIMVLVGGSAMVAYPFVLGLLPLKGDFSSSWLPFAILTAGAVAASGFLPFSGILHLGGNPGRQTILTILVVSGNVALNFILIPPFGLAGAACATAATYVFRSALLVIFTKRLYNIRLW